MTKKQLKSQAYWKKRMDDILADVDKMDVAFYNNMQQTYLDSLKDVQKDIYDFYARYAKDNEISYSEAKRRLLREDLSDYRANAEKYFKQAEKDPELLKRLNEQYQAGKVTRLEALNLSLEYQLGVLNGTLQQSFSDYLKGVANHVYKKVNFGLSSSTLNKPALEELIKTKMDGKNYSSSLWGNTDELAKDLKQALKEGFVRGSSPADIARELRKKYNVARSRAETIIRTDGTNIINNATIRRYKEAGLTEYEFMAHLDSRTTQICRDHNKKIYLIDDYQPGLNAPPMHYNCRSTIIPTERELGMEPGWDNKVKVHNEKYIDRKTNKMEFDRNKKILKDDKLSFDKFQQMKYNGGSEWEKYNRKVSTISEIQNKSWNKPFKDKTLDLYTEFYENGIEFSSHSLGRYAQRTDLSVDDALSILNQKANYLQEDGRKVWFYDGHVFVKNKDETEVVTYVYRKNKKPKGGETPWKLI